MRSSQELVTHQLLAAGWEPDHVDKVVQAWIRQNDYLLGDHWSQGADFVVGNPSYIRLEDVPDARMNAYRFSCPTIGGRDVDAFHEQVSVYPAITIIKNAPQGQAIAADTTQAFGPYEAADFRAWTLTTDQPFINAPSYHAARLPHWFPATTRGPLPHRRAWPCWTISVLGSRF